MYIEPEVPDKYLSLREQFIKQVNKLSMLERFEGKDIELRQGIKRKIKKGELF
jgi:hypothetical protein